MSSSTPPPAARLNMKSEATGQLYTVPSSASKPNHLAQPTLVEQPLHEARRVVEPPGHAHGQGGAARLGRGQHAVALGRGHRHRLLDQHVHPVFEQVRGHLGVQVVRKRHDRRVDLADEVAVVGHRQPDAALVRQLAGSLRVNVAEPGQLGHAGGVEDHQVQLGHGAAADDREARTLASKRAHPATSGLPTAGPAPEWSRRGSAPASPAAGGPDASRGTSISG